MSLVGGTASPLWRPEVCCPKCLCCCMSASPQARHSAGVCGGVVAKNCSSSVSQAHVPATGRHLQLYDTCTSTRGTGKREGPASSGDGSAPHRGGVAPPWPSSPLWAAFSREATGRAGPRHTRRSRLSARSQRRKAECSCAGVAPRVGHGAPHPSDRCHSAGGGTLPGRQGLPVLCLLLSARRNGRGTPGGRRRQANHLYPHSLIAINQETPSGRQDSLFLGPGGRKARAVWAHLCVISSGLATRGPPQ